MPPLQRQSFLAAWLRFAADCLYLAVYFATKFLLGVTEGWLSISSVLAFQVLVAAALVASAVLISPTAAGSSSLSKGIARK